MSTGLYQIESCINSRSITTLLSDPSDFQDFTPGHFLIGSQITGIPEHISTDHIRCPIQNYGVSLRYFVNISGTDGPKNASAPVANSPKVDIIYTRSSGA
ncbi:hypothetical protein TNIN_427901 [Trichonephila inaurata madagascariensis]|uniref:Uncharacterized protein n=1 Tax=Trichonephila inaurata madagascariensis TaxID=2747483 RepID=A0A8X6KDU2_9ARAC|nr:hypothetical protein TNIN_427901 [Trichonephila inaurata madagascariensis]